MATKKKDPEPTYDLDWEHVREDALWSMYQKLYRAKVPGGWFVERYHEGNGSSKPASMFFCPDPKHEWKLLPKPKKG